MYWTGDNVLSDVDVGAEELDGRSELDVERSANVELEERLRTKLDDDVAIREELEAAPTPAAVELGVRVVEELVEERVEEVEDVSLESEVSLSEDVEVSAESLDRDDAPGARELSARVVNSPPVNERSIERELSGAGWLIFKVVNSPPIREERKLTPSNVFTRRSWAC